MRKLICPECNTEIEVDEAKQTFYCEHCQKEQDTTIAFKTTQNYVNTLLRNAIKYMENAYSYKEAYLHYKEFLKFVPTDLNAKLGMFYALIKTSSLKVNVFDQFIDEFNKSDILLKSDTYIRLGHFFEQILNAIFFYQNELIKFIEIANDTEKEIAYFDLLSLIKMYNFVQENLALFTEEEYLDSIFIKQEEIELNKEKLLKYLRTAEIFDINYLNINESSYYVGNKKIIYKEFKIENYDDVQDFALFKVASGGAKLSILIFTGLIVSVIAILIGVVFLFIKDLQTAGWITAGIGAAAFIGLYIGFNFYRKKSLKKIGADIN